MGRSRTVLEQGLERGEGERERRRRARLLVAGVGGERVGDAGMDAAGEVVGESGGDVPPRGERHGCARAYRGGARWEATAEPGASCLL